MKEKDVSRLEDELDALLTELDGQKKQMTFQQHQKLTRRLAMLREAEAEGLKIDEGLVDEAKTYLVTKDSKLGNIKPIKYEHDELKQAEMALACVKRNADFLPPELLERAHARVEAARAKTNVPGKE